MKYTIIADVPNGAYLTERSMYNYTGNLAKALIFTDQSSALDALESIKECGIFGIKVISVSKKEVFRANLIGGVE